MDAHGASHEAEPALDAPEAVGALRVLYRGVHLEALAAVIDRNAQDAVRLPERDRGLQDARVLDDVEQNLAKRSEQDDACRLIQLGRRALGLDLDMQSVSLAHLLDERPA